MPAAEPTLRGWMSVDDTGRNRMSKKKMPFITVTSRRSDWIENYCPDAFIAFLDVVICA
jgi:hypothetical protein